MLANEPENEEDSDFEEEDEALDSVRRNQLDLEGSTFMTNADPSAEVITNLPDEESARVGNERKPRVAVAPGEGKIPTSLTNDKYWDAMAFPKLYPTGRFGLHHPRKHSARKNLETV